MSLTKQTCPVARLSLCSRFRSFGSLRESGFGGDKEGEGERGEEEGDGLEL